jgi:hypothetical protein
MLSGKSTVAVSEPIENGHCLSQTNYVNVAAFVLQSNGRQAGEERLLVRHLDGTAAVERAR